MSSTVTFDIPRDATAPSAARRAIDELNGRIAPDVVPDVKLLVSELITNSVKYGGNGEVTLKVEAEDPRRLRVEVIDQGVGFVPVARDRPATEVGGWGLHLVSMKEDGLSTAVALRAQGPRVGRWRAALMSLSPRRGCGDWAKSECSSGGACPK
jgi:anti-sigma regulatory factor (Ser/Thr protein kinase)